MISATQLARRAAQAGSDPARMAAVAGQQSSKVTTWREHEVRIVKLTAAGIGVATGETETVADPRDGREIVRERLDFLPRKHVRLVSGELREGATAVLEVPSWVSFRT